MQSTIPSTSRPTTQGNVLGYLCTLVLLMFAIGLLALGAPEAAFSPAPNHVAAPVATPLYQIDGQ